MSQMITSEMPAPCLFSSVYTSGWAWRIHARLYLLSAEVVEGISEGVLAVAEVRVRADLVLFLPRAGIALVWCREDLPVDIISLSDANPDDAIHFLDAFVQPCQWTTKEEPVSASRWGFDEQHRLLIFIHAGQDIKSAISLKKYFTEDLLVAWDRGEMAHLWQCVPCGVLDATAGRNSRCGRCGEPVTLAAIQAEDQDVSIQILENVIHRLGYDPVLCRQGPLSWVVPKGSVQMHLRYAREEASLCADVLLVRIGPQTKRKELFHYLLQENIKLDDFGFSIQDDKVVITLLITAKAIKEQALTALFEDLLRKSDDYDNHLVSVFDAEWL